MSVATVLADKRVYLQHTFDLPDSAVSTGTANTGQPVYSKLGTWGISGKVAVWVARNDTFDYAAYDAGKSDAQSSIMFMGSRNNSRLIFRFIDADNCYYISRNSGGIVLNRRVAGVNSVLATVTDTIAIGDVITIRAMGDLIIGYKNGVQLYAVTSSDHRTGTIYGFGINSTLIVDTAYDNLMVVEL